ncbi:MAG: hypothetical protein AUJ34_02585 [Parcubacteria group bacterium CG1_02_41_12]|nr:MAG: hypothetical protein AUJ34_02585 [Parcubacteria group bacterium CG1_02_41_12]PIZ78404.1 MAG: hypothetical protein COY02_04135 [Parcubacteria group bacterium CG_4_10_14_0_2_um_filter_41_6]
MNITIKGKYIVLGLFVAFSAFAFSCCNMPIKHEAMAGMNSEHAEHNHNQECCKILENQAMLSFHNQPISFPSFGGIIFAAVLSLIASAFFAFTPLFVQRFLLYEKQIRARIGSASVFNLFILIFSKGILNSKVF